jgi:hypothetical protein
MIDRTHALPVARQCQVLSLARSTAYYRPQEASEAELALMRRMTSYTWNIRLPAAACCAICSSGKAIRSAASMSSR